MDYDPLEDLSVLYAHIDGRNQELPGIQLAHSRLRDFLLESAKPASANAKPKTSSKTKAK